MESNCNNTTVFVGGISLSTNYDDLMNHFSKYGKIQKIVIPNENSGSEFKGYALVTYEKTEDFDTCLLENHVVNDRKIKCTPALSKSQARKITEEKCKKK